MKHRMEDIEREIYKQPDTVIKDYAIDLFLEVLRLQHELVDPRYMYSGRISRAAILSRNGEIDRLHDEICELKGKMADANIPPI